MQSSHIRQFFDAIKAYRLAWRFVVTNRMWWIFLVPFGLAVGLFSLVDWLSGQLHIHLWELISGHFPILLEPSWWWEFTSWLLKLTLKVLLFLFYLKIYRYLTLLLLSPVFSMVSELLQNKLTGHQKPFSFVATLKDFWRGVRVAFRNLSRELFYSLIIYVLALLLPIGLPIYSILLLLVESYFWGAAMIDYRNEYFGLSVRKSIDMQSKFKGLAIGNGLILNLGLLVPLAGITFMPMLALISAGISLHQKHTAS